MVTVQGRRRGFKSWFVEPYRQVKLGLMFLIVNIIFSALIFGVFGYYVWEIYGAISTYFNFADQQNATLFAKLLVPVIVGACLMVLFVVTTLLVSVKYTHQIYGPLVSIHRFLDALLESRRADPLQLRESDQLKELANKLNAISELYITDKRGASSLVPIYRFIDELISGQKPTSLTLRETDQYKLLADKLNTLASKMN